MHLFLNRVSYNRFVELEKEGLLQPTVFIKEVLMVLVSASVLWIPLHCVYVGISAFSFIRLSKVLRNVENVPWDGSSALNFTWLSIIKGKYSTLCSRPEMWMNANRWNSKGFWRISRRSSARTRAISGRPCSRIFSRRHTADNQSEEQYEELFDEHSGQDFAK